LVIYNLTLTDNIINKLGLWKNYLTFKF
jgi:hypothetical protein